MSKKPVSSQAAEMRAHDIGTLCGEIVGLVKTIEMKAKMLRVSRSLVMDVNFARMIQAHAEVLLKIANELNETV